MDAPDGREDLLQVALDHGAEGLDLVAHASMLDLLECSRDLRADVAVGLGAARGSSAVGRRGHDLLVSPLPACPTGPTAPAESNP